MNFRFGRKKYRYMWETAFAFFGRKRRTQSVSQAKYEDSWEKRHQKLYDMSFYTREVSLDGRPAIQSSADDYKLLISEFDSLIKSLNPKRVLEVGSGNGLMILGLAMLNPNIEWVGVELTESGVESSRHLLEKPPADALRYMTGVDANILKSVNIRFVQGNALSLPFEDSSFDGVFTCTAIEQIPRDYMQAFAEIRRVTSKYAFFYEGFNEANNILQRIQRWVIDDFRGSFREVGKVGFDIMSYRKLGLDKIAHCNALLVCRKTKSV